MSLLGSVSKVYVKLVYNLQNRCTTDDFGKIHKLWIIRPSKAYFHYYGFCARAIYFQN